MTAMRIREATPADIDAMHRIRMDVRENRLSDPAWLTPDVYRACLAEAGTANTWVAEVDGRIAGFCTGRVAQADVWALFVDPAREGLGIGRALLDVATRWLFARGVATIALTTTPSTRADRFYAAAGWERGGIDAKGEVAYRLQDSPRASNTTSETPC